jgi:hypothetical protein
MVRPIRQQEEAAHQDFAATRAQAGVLEGRIARLQQGLAIQDAFVRRSLAGGEEPAAWEFYRQCVADLGGQLAACRRELAGVTRKLQTQREELLRLMKQRKAFEQLIERLAVEESARVGRIEVKEADQAHAVQRQWRGQQSWPGQAQETVEMQDESWVQ